MATETVTFLVVLGFAVVLGMFSVILNSVVVIPIGSIVLALILYNIKD